MKEAERSQPAPPAVCTTQLTHPWKSQQGHFFIQIWVYSFWMCKDEFSTSRLQTWINVKKKMTKKHIFIIFFLYYELLTVHNKLKSYVVSVSWYKPHDVFNHKMFTCYLLMSYWIIWVRSFWVPAILLTESLSATLSKCVIGCRAETISFKIKQLENSLTYFFWLIYFWSDFPSKKIPEHFLPLEFQYYYNLISLHAVGQTKFAILINWVPWTCSFIKRLKSVIISSSKFVIYFTKAMHNPFN